MFGIFFTLNCRYLAVAGVCKLGSKPLKHRACSINLLKPTGYVMHQQFNIQQLYVLPTLYFVFCIYLRTNSDLCHLQHKLSGFYNRDEKFTARYELGI